MCVGMYRLMYYYLIFLSLFFLPSTNKYSTFILLFLTPLLSFPLSYLLSSPLFSSLCMIGPSEASIAAYHLKISDEDKKEKEETDKLRAENGEEPVVEELPEGIG